VTASRLNEHGSVSAAAAFTPTSTVNNEKVMSHISYEDTRWTVEAVCHLQRLIFRTVVVLCDAALRNGADLQVRSLLKEFDF